MLSAAARVWYARMLQAAPFTPFPRDAPIVRSGEGVADRILLIGNGPLHGWGVTRREIAAPGHLARVVHRRTGRPAAVEYVGDERMDAATAIAWLGSAATRGHDVVVIALGMNDALRLTRVQRWRTHVHALLDVVLRDTDEGVPVLVVGLPHVRRYLMADSWMGAVANRRAVAMTRVLQDAAAGSERVAFVPAPTERFEPDRPIGSSAMYRAWAEELADHVLPGLEGVRALRPAAPEPAARRDWVGTGSALDRSATGPVSERLDALVDTVRQRFGVAVAMVDLLDGEHAYPIAGGAGAPRAMPRSLVYCDTAVQEDAALVVLDAKQDPRFSDNPFLELLGMPFYAGVPLHASDGRAVATLCVLDSAARASFDVQELRRFAALAESELRGLEARPSQATLSADRPFR